MNGEIVSKVWTDLLQFPGFAVVHMEQDSSHQRYFITVVPEHSIGVCPQCHRTCETIKQRRCRDRILDLPIGSHAVELPFVWDNSSASTAVNVSLRRSLS